MFNVAAFNVEAYNVGSPFAASLVTDDIIFNDYGLQNNNIIISNTDFWDYPNIALNTYINPIVDWWGVLGRQYTSKDITFNGVLKADSENALNTLIDEFKYNLSAVEWYLDIKVNGVYRRTKATVASSKVIKRRWVDITRAPFEVVFRTVEPFSYLIQDQSWLDGWVTGNVNLSKTYNGTAPSFPIFYITFWPSVSSVTTISVQIWDRLLTISKTVGNNGILTIDGETKQVLYNSVAIDTYTGQFPFLQNGTQNITININWTFTADISTVYKQNYL